MTAVYRTQAIGTLQEPDHIIQYHGPPLSKKESIRGFRRPKISPMKRPSMQVQREKSLNRHGSKRKLYHEYRVPTKTAFHKPGYYQFPHSEYGTRHTKRVKSVKLKPKYKNSLDIDSIFKLSGESLNRSTIPYYLIQYSLRNWYDGCKKNPVIRYEIENTTLKGDEIVLEDSGFNMEQYLTLPISDIMHSVEENKVKTVKKIAYMKTKFVPLQYKANRNSSPLSMESWTNDQMKKYGLNTRSLRSLDQTDYSIKKKSIGGISEIAELSIESSSELYDEYFADISGGHFNTWGEACSYLEKESPEFYSNDYFLLRLMLDIYIRRIVAARISASIGTERARRVPDLSVDEIWHLLADNVKAVYGLKQLHVFQQQK